MENNDNKNARFLRLYTSVQPKLYSYILAVVHNRSDADELLQETSIILWDNFEKYDEKYSFSAWAIGIAKNKIFEYLRANKKARKLFSDIVYDKISEIAQEAEDDVVERLETVKSCFAKLGSSDQKLMTYKYYKNNTVKQISEVTGRSTNSLYKSFTRIIIQLRKCVDRCMSSGEYHV